MHPDDLKTIWECKECGRKFVYYSDVSNHAKELRHQDIVSRDLHARRKKGAVFVRRNLSVKFRVAGRSMTAEFDCKYYPSTESIVYTSVSYSSEELQRTIEGSNHMMARLDNYLRNIFRGESATKPTI